MKNDDRLSELKTLALSIPYDKTLTRVVACITLRGRVISYGFNSRKTHPFQKKYAKNPSAIHWHAETNAIFNALKNGHTKEDLQYSTLYVARVRKVRGSDGRLHDAFGSAKPCTGCMKCVNTYKIPSIVYSNDEVVL